MTNNDSAPRTMGQSIAIVVFIAYCIAAIPFSMLLGASILESPYTVNWAGVFIVLVMSGAFASAFERIPDHAEIKQSLYFVLIFLAIATVFVVIGVALHVNGSPPVGADPDFHPSETVLEFLFLLNVSTASRPSFSMAFAHSIVIATIAAAIMQKRQARSVHGVTDFT